MLGQVGKGAGALVLAAAMAGGLAGCGSAQLFTSYDVPETTDVDAAPWPRLADVPPTPPPGTFTDQIPDPEKGRALERDLSAFAVEGEVRAADLSQPVLTEAERRRLLGR